VSESPNSINELLGSKFKQNHVDAAIRHFESSVEEFGLAKWENATAKGGKCIEAALKALWVFVGEPVPPAKEFKVGTIINRLEQKSGFADTIRLTIPRACRFAYEIASNRGARHDADEIEANEMDSRAVLGVCAWILAEMVRFSQKGGNPVPPQQVVDGLMRRRFPFAENIDGRVYANIGNSAKDVALVVLYYIYPRRINRTELIASLVRHAFKKANASVAVQRIAGFIDDDGNGMLRLRNSGIQEVERLIAEEAKALNRA
jgi:hypothetical protein